MRSPAIGVPASPAVHRWQDVRVSIATVEQATGYTFLAAVPPAVAGPLKAKVDNL